MELKITLKGEDKKKLEDLQKLFKDVKPQTTLRRLINNFKL